MTAPILPDADARAQITHVLDKNIVVEAAAGTGKTTCLVARICELVKAGALRGDARFAAVTFTLKAANELKQRLQAELERQAAAADTPDNQRSLLRQGRDALAECHIGTIHSFCARLLRERPVEAGVNPAFQELDQTDDALFRHRAWTEFARRLAAGRYQNLTDTFRTFDLDMDILESGFLRFAEYPDVSQWLGDDFNPEDIDLNAFRLSLADYNACLADIAQPLEKADAKTDELIPILQTLARRALRPFPAKVEAAHRLSRIFRAKPKFIKMHWKKNFSCPPEENEERHAAYLRFYADSVKPFRDQCQAAVYAAALTAFQLAKKIYDRLRHEAGVLNFQDLLMTTARVLRDYPDVRRELSGRYRRLLVDEVQDTDPIQAEILLLLAGEDAAERDWRRTTPRPGSLFIVGDPKQSIYRFRRADIVVYQELKEMVVRHDGLLLELVANFRSQPVILDWVNNAFGPSEDADADADGKFSRQDTPYSPAYVPLFPGRAEATACDLSGVYRLELLAGKNKGDNPVGTADILADEAQRIASFIRHACDAGLTVPDRGRSRPATPGDFMIVTYQKAKAPLYAAALGRLGIECEVSAGGALSASPALDMLETYLAALANPDDPVAVLAVLRGPLYGVADTDLYRWKKAGHSFLFPQVPPEKDVAGPEPIARAFYRLNAHHRLFRRFDPLECFERIIDDLGLWAFSCLGDDPVAASGALFTVVELLRTEQGALAGPGGLAQRLAWVREHYDGEVMPACPSPGDAVRVMNVHKTKGLEAPIVFLTSTRNLRARPPHFSIGRYGNSVLGGMVLSRGEFGNVVLACPIEWETMAERESQFLDAEKTRLNYVAATRAGSMLVVSTHSASGVLKSSFLPPGNAATFLPDALPEPAVTPQATAAETPLQLDADAFLSLAANRSEALERIKRATYELERAKPDHVAADIPLPAGSEVAVADPELAVEMGEILHRLLETDYDDDALTMAAEAQLREYERPLAFAPELAGLVRGVKSSEIWRRAEAATHRFREVPFSLAEERDGRQVVQRGVIDLAFREDDGWVIVDYKSDRIPEGVSPEDIAKRHAGQLDAYRIAWEKATNEHVAETLIFFVRAGVAVKVAATPPEP